MSTELALALILCGGVAGGLAIFARALPWPPEWKRRKPLACPACMGGWSSFASVALVSESGLCSFSNLPLVTLAWLISTGIAACMFAYVNPPMIELPEPDLPSESGSE